MNSYLTKEELENVGFSSLGEDILISRKCSFYNPERIKISSHVRIDDFCMVSVGSEGYLDIGNYVHIAAFCAIYASSKISLDDFSGLSARCTIFGSTDDFVFGYLTNPTVPESFRKVKTADVHIGKHCVIGSNSIIMPGVSIGDYSSIGAFSFVNRNVQENIVASGNPLKKLLLRNTLLLRELEKQLLSPDSEIDKCQDCED